MRKTLASLAAAVMIAAGGVFAPAPAAQAKPVVLCPSSEYSSDYINHGTYGKHSNTGKITVLRLNRGYSGGKCHYKYTRTLRVYKAEIGCWVRNSYIHTRPGAAWTTEARGVALHYCVPPKKSHYVMSDWIG